MSVVKENIFFKTGREWTKVDKNEIVYIKSDGCYCIISTDAKKIVVNAKIGSLTNSSGLTDHFIRIHKQYIINLNYLTNISKSYATLGLSKIPIGKEYRDELLNKLFFIDQET